MPRWQSRVLCSLNYGKKNNRRYFYTLLRRSAFSGNSYEHGKSARKGRMRGKL